MAAANASSIGLQHPAFFVGRAELLDWVNKWRDYLNATGYQSLLPMG